MRQIHWLGHASFRISAQITIYIDPWKIASKAVTADIILISHGHFDHLSRKDIDRISGPKTTLIVPKSCESTLNRECRTMAPGEVLELKGISIEAIRSYNTTKAFHPQSNDWLGYLIRLEEETIYYAGDCDLIPEMSEISADTALLPVGGTYTMNAQEAVEAAKRVGAKRAIPMHWGDVVGSREDAEHFVELAKREGIEALLLEAER